MCGIFGWVSFGAEISADRINAARRSVRSMGHRGPDNQGEWLSPHVFMGHRRLSIIDLSAAANQPFASVDGRYVLSFNGEIYNYVELRKILEAQGVAFTTDSDTETMSAALAAWGYDALLQFDGMFAAAWHDTKTNRHVLMRDPLGQKPLYYHVYGDGVVYASELRALLELPGFLWAIDQEAFKRYLMQGYYALEETPIAGIKKLLPGHFLEIDSNNIRCKRYWNSISGDNIQDISDDEAIDEFDRLFQNSCRQSMRADVPYGVLLSGGIDSSLVLQYCKEINHDIRSFSVAMADREFDESKKASAVNEFLGVSKCHSFLLTDEGVLGAIEGLFKDIDEPHGDPGFVNSYFLAQACRPHLAVAIGGDGSDELFAGYAPFAGLPGVLALRNVPDMGIKAIKTVARQFPARDGYLGFRFKLDAYLGGFPGSDEQRFPLWLSSMEPENLDRLCRPIGDGTLSRGRIFKNIETTLEPVAGKELQEKFLYFYQKVFLPEFVCMHTDRATMQYSLEARSPFLSRPLIEFANRLPRRMRIRFGERKWLLKETMRRRGYPDVVTKQKKQGFTFPVARWLKTSMREELNQTCNDDERLSDFVDMGELKRLRDEHLGGQENHYRVLFNLMVFRRWRRRYPSLIVQ